MTFEEIKKAIENGTKIKHLDRASFSPTRLYFLDNEWVVGIEGERHNILFPIGECKLATSALDEFPKPSGSNVDHYDADEIDTWMNKWESKLKELR